MVKRGLAIAWLSAVPIFGQLADKLLAGPEHADIRWAITIPQPALTPFQRYATRISIRVDGKEIARRDGKGEFLFAAEFKDSSNRPFRTQSRVNLEDYQKATAQHELECAVQLFILPGDYEISLGVIEPSTEKSSVTHRTLHVAPLANDPLPGLWHGMPPVEFIDFPDAPDRWF